MANINYTAIDFRERITLLEAVEERDKEQNLIVSHREIAEVWANVQIKPRYVQTQTGEKPYYLNHITIRYNPSLLGRINAISWNGKIQELTLPPYVVNNKYIVFEVEEVYGKEPKPCEFSGLP